MGARGNEPKWELAHAGARVQAFLEYFRRAHGGAELFACRRHPLLTTGSLVAPAPALPAIV